MTGATTAYDLLVGDGRDAWADYPADDRGPALSFAERQDAFHPRPAAELEIAFRSGVTLKEGALARIAIRRSAEGLPIPPHLSNAGEDLSDPTRLRPVPVPYIGALPRPTLSQAAKPELGYMLVDYMDDEVTASPVRGYVSKEDFPSLYQAAKPRALAAAPVIESPLNPARQAAPTVRVARVADTGTPPYLRWVSSFDVQKGDEELRGASLALLAEMARDAAERAAAEASKLSVANSVMVNPRENPFNGLLEDDDNPESSDAQQPMDEFGTVAPIVDAPAVVLSSEEVLVAAQRDQALRECNETLPPPAALPEEGAFDQPAAEESKRKHLAFLRRVLRGLHSL